MIWQWKWLKWLLDAHDEVLLVEMKKVLNHLVRHAATVQLWLPMFKDYLGMEEMQRGSEDDNRNGEPNGKEDTIHLVLFSSAEQKLGGRQYFL